jgi:hypothetical protein
LAAIVVASRRQAKESGDFLDTVDVELRTITGLPSRSIGSTGKQGAQRARKSEVHMNVQGIVIGAVMVIVVVGAAGIWFFRRRTRGDEGVAALRQQARRLLEGRRGRPTIRVKVLQDPRIDWSRTKPVGPVETRAVGDFVTRFMMAGGVGLSGLHDTLRIVFPPEVQAMLYERTAWLMRSIQEGVYPVAVGAHGRIVGLGRLISGTSISPAAVAAAAWQVLAMVTAQHYLVLINDSLKRIQSSIDDIKAWLDIEKVTQLQAALRYLGHVHDVVSKGLLAESDVLIFAGELERIWREACAMEGLSRALMDREQKKLFEMRLDGLFAVDDRLVAANEHILSYQHYATACLVALIVEAATLAARCSLPLPRGDVAKRLGQVRDEASAWRQHCEKTLDTMEGRMGKARPRIDPFRVQAKARPELLAGCRDALKQCNDVHNSAQAELSNIQEAIEEQVRSAERPLEYVVKFSEDGQPSQVWRYHPAQPAQVEKKPAEGNLLNAEVYPSVA